jgi:hypothetical protein
MAGGRRGWLVAAIKVGLLELLARPPGASSGSPRAMLRLASFIREICADARFFVVMAWPHRTISVAARLADRVIFAFSVPPKIGRTRHWQSGLTGTAVPNRLSAAALAALGEDFAQYGAATIQKVRAEGRIYLQIIAFVAASAAGRAHITARRHQRRGACADRGDAGRKILR